MRLRSACSALTVGLLVSGVSFAEDPAAEDQAAVDSPEVVQLKAKLEEVRSLVEKELPKLQKEAEKAEKALSGVAKSRYACRERASETRSRCEDNCEETMRRCKVANWFRSNAQQGCEDRGEVCNSNCSAAETKACASLVAKEEKLEEAVKSPEVARLKIKAAENAIKEQKGKEVFRAEQARKVRKMIEAVAAACGGRYVLEDPGDWESRSPDGSGSGRVLDTRTGLRWLRFTGPRGQNQAQADSYCSGKEMRLPTKDEALLIANSCEKAWPKGWDTWTSTLAAVDAFEGREAWYVFGYNGNTSKYRVDRTGGNGFHDGGALCVR